MSPTTRAVPRPFNYHWGSGQVIEEAAYTAEHHEPAIQLLQYDEGEAAGSWSVRFCFYNRDGRFQRSPLMVGQDEIDGLRAALKATPRLRKLLRQLVSDA
jgi:hypothetical protein